jgi:hypothetical protein
MVDRKVLREGSDTQVAGPGINLAADLVIPLVVADGRDDARQARFYLNLLTHQQIL